MPVCSPAYFDEWSFSLPARQDELRKGKQNDEHLESESLSAPPISHDVGGIGDIRNAGHLDAVGFPGISAPVKNAVCMTLRNQVEYGSVVLLRDLHLAGRRDSAIERGAGGIWKGATCRGRILLPHLHSGMTGPLIAVT